MNRASPIRKVNFVIAGVQKAGTTALSHFLSEHDGVFIPPREMHYFDRDERDWTSPDHGGYERRFDAARVEQIVGEKTPIYMFWDNAIERIRAYNSDMKLIVSLRHPTDRAYSHWRMERIRGHETQSFSQAIRGGRARVKRPAGPKQLPKRRFSYVERGYYAGQIRRILREFPRAQLHFLTQDWLAKDTAAELNRICGFLGIAPFVRPPENRHVIPRLGGQSAHDFAAGAIPPMSDVDRDYLDSLFAEDIVATQELTRLDLSHWRRG